jgi:hypothetical protein
MRGLGVAGAEHIVSKFEDIVEYGFSGILQGLRYIRLFDMIAFHCESLSKRMLG